MTAIIGGGGGGLTFGTPVSPSGVSQVDLTGLPAGLSRVRVVFNGLSYASNDILALRIGDAGGIEATGYDAASALVDGGEARSTDRFPLYPATTGGSELMYGFFELARLSASAHYWAASWNLWTAPSQLNLNLGAGGKTLSAELDRVRLYTTGGQNFDGGTINVQFG